MARHAYLGDLEDVAHPHAAHYANGAIVELPLIFLRDIVLFPGEELPMRVLSDTNLESIRDRLTSEASMLAVLCLGQGEPIYGTTIRVERVGLSANSATLTGAAKQRIRLRSMKRFPGGRGIYGTVEVLADLRPPSLPFAPLWRFRSEIAQDAAAPSSMQRRRRLNPRFPSFWGMEQFAMFDASHLVNRIQQIMISSAHCNWFRKLTLQEPSKENLVKHLTGPSQQQDPVRFAFWIAANLPVGHGVRLELLKTDCIVRLLRREISILEQLDESVYCSRCGTFLAHTRDIFSVGDDGVAGTFVNPSGFVHQIMTLREVHTDALYVNSERSTEDSWFPGYAWSIVECGVCFSHLGWQFDSVDASASPERFFGFRRTALTQSWSANHNTSRPDWTMIRYDDEVGEDHSEIDDDDHEEDADLEPGDSYDSSSDSDSESNDVFYDVIQMD